MTAPVLPSEPARPPAASVRDPRRLAGPTTPPAPPVGTPRPQWAPGLATDVALAAVNVAAAASLLRVLAGRQWVGHVAVSLLGTQAVAWALRRSRLPRLVAQSAGFAAAILITLWAGLPAAATTDGIPTLATVRTITRTVHQLAAVFDASAAPVPATGGFLLLAVAGTALVAWWSDLARYPRTPPRSPFIDILPAFALFLTCSVAAVDAGRTWAVLLMVVASTGYLLVHALDTTESGSVWFANRRQGVAAWGVGAAAGGLLVAVAGTLVLSANLPAADGHGVIGWKLGGPGGSGGNRSVPSPIVDLSTRLLQLQDTKVFTVTSPVPSYWRLTSLDEFTGVQWQSTDSYVNVHHALPGTSAPPGSRAVQQTFTIQDLASIWMPTAFSPQAIRGGGAVSWDPVSGSLLAAHATSDGLHYTLTSVQALGAVDAAKLAAAGIPAVPPSMERYLQLPNSVPASVRRLAASIVRGAPNEYAKALALQNYFIDNPAFSYTTDPPADGYGISALTTFLFQTRQGYCQQFAGAYAVMARAVGLPTRLAFGFNTGTALGDDTYQVLDADAHTWPEVWFGKQLGWLPFEPTKGGGFAIPGAAYTGPTGGEGTTRAAPTTLVPTTTSAPLPPSHPTRTLPRILNPVPAATTRPTHGSSAGPLAVAGLAGAGLAWWLANAGGRRWRWRRRRRQAGTPTASVCTSWEEVSELLAWWGCRRRADETILEFAARACRELRLPLQLGGHGPSQLRELASETTAAIYRPVPPGSAQVQAARSQSRALVDALLVAAPRSRRLLRSLDPRWSWRRPPVDPPAGPQAATSAEGSAVPAKPASQPLSGVLE